MNFYATEIVFLDKYLEYLGFDRLSQKYANKGLTLKKTLSDKRYRHICASPDFEAQIDNIVNASYFTDEVNDACDFCIEANGKVLLVAD